jgi:hypothetical protein
MFCGRCDLNYVEGELLVHSNPHNSTAQHGDRYGLHMGSCVRCQSPAVIGLALFGLFLLLFAYNAFGMCMQLRNSGIRDPYLRFVKTLAAQQAAAQQQNPQQQQQQVGGGSSGGLQPQGSGWTGVMPLGGSTNTLARDSSSSQASQSQGGLGQGQQTQLLHQGRSGTTSSSTHPQVQGPLGHCYSVHSALSTQQLSYGFAVPFAAVGGGGLGSAGTPSLPMQPSVLPVVRSGEMQQQQQHQQGLPGPTRSRTLPTPFLASSGRQGSWGGAGAAGNSGVLSPAPSLGSPFLQQSHLPPLLPSFSIHPQQPYHQQHQQPHQQQPQQQRGRQQSAPGGQQQQQQQQQQSLPAASQGGRRVSWETSVSGSDTPPPAQASPAPGTLPRAQTMPAHSIAAHAAASRVTPATAADGAAAAPAAAAAAAAGAGGAGGAGPGPARSASASPPGVPAAAAGGSSFVFAGSQGDQQQPRDQQQRQPSPQDRWWGSAANGASPQRQQSLPPTPSHQQQQQQYHQGGVSPLQQQQHSMQQHGGVSPLQQPHHSMHQPGVSYGGPQQSVPFGSMRFRYQSSVLTSVATSAAGQHSTAAGRGPGLQSMTTNSSSHPSRRPSNSSGGGNRPQQQQQTQQSQSQQQQQQQAGFRKGPAGLLVGLWKVLTSYLQVRDRQLAASTF